MDLLNKRHSVLIELMEARMHRLQSGRQMQTTNPHYCLPGRCDFISSDLDPSMFICVQSGEIHWCPGAVPDSSKTCAYTRDMYRQMHRVCTLTGVDQSDKVDRVQDHPLSRLILETRVSNLLEKKTQQAKILRTAAITKARNVILKLVYGSDREFVYAKAQRHQKQMTHALDRKRNQSMAHRDKMCKHMGDINRTFMQRPLKDAVQAKRFAAALVTEAMDTLRLMKCTDKEIPLMCIGYLYTIRKGVWAHDGNVIIPSHASLPMPGIHRITEIELKNLTKLRRLTSSTNRIRHFIMNSSCVRRRIEDIYVHSIPRKSAGHAFVGITRETLSE